MPASALPSCMTIAHPRQPGGPEMLEMSTRPVPSPAAGEVLIRVHAAGVNRADCMQREGNYPVPGGATDIIGLECAGEVVATGSGTSRYRVGDRVAALLVGGGYAQYVCTPEAQCLPVPGGLDWIQAAAWMETACTVWSNVSMRAGLQPSERLLVHGGTSGIGVTAIQLYAALGHTVYATAGSETKCRACVELGAAAAIHYREQDFVTEVRRLTGGEGVDVVLDMVGGDYLSRSLSVLRDDGRFVGIAASQGRQATVDLMELYRRRLTLTGSGLRRQPLPVKAGIVAQVERHVWPLVAQGRIKAVVDSVFPLAEAARAHAHMESSAHIGKIVLAVD